MGLFDTFHYAFVCPYCGHIVNMDFQTKELPCLLDNYFIADLVRGSRKNQTIRNALANHDCKKGIYNLIKGDIVIKNNRFNKIINIRKK